MFTSSAGPPRALKSHVNLWGDQQAASRVYVNRSRDKRVQSEAWKIFVGTLTSSFRRQRLW